ncbi:hypothetical protein [Inquilinus limosus]|uniref:DUF2730 family protein n=1 Tax=Inquilinus limosus MP06 TaxID=1398085 RepID=A0A0A0DCG8_9PROT|nr:hypothetical protein [Inquilinus limosus]KGM35720.1 hypothetical protein P409_02765 [Inquilinus limosus MP06]
MSELLDLVPRHWLWVTTLISILVALALLLLRQRFATQEQMTAVVASVSDLAKRLDGEVDRVDQRAGVFERRTDLIEERMRHMPTSDDMKALQAGLALQNASIEKLNAKSESHTGQLASIADQLGMLTNHLLGRGER